MLTVPLICLVFALGLSGYALVESRARGLVGWAVFLVALALLWERLPR